MPIMSSNVCRASALDTTIFAAILRPPSISTPVTRPSSRRMRVTGVLRASSPPPRSEEHTSELQSQSNIVCRLLLEKKKDVVRDRPHGRQGHVPEGGADLELLVGRECLAAAGRRGEYGLDGLSSLARNSRLTQHCAK